MDYRRDWSALQSDVLVEIAFRVPFIEDVMAMRGVCSSWRVVMSNNKVHSRSSYPLLMLPGIFPVKKKENDEREFFSLTKLEIVMSLALPETKLKRCFGVGFGWILTVASSGDAILLNPFSREQIQLPNLKSPPCSGPHYLDEFGFITRAVLSANPSNSSNFVLLATFSPLGLGFWKVGNDCWNKIEPFVPTVPFSDIIYYKEKFYAVDELAKEIWVWDPSGCPSPNKAEVIFKVQTPWELVYDIYMVESSTAELLLVSYVNNAGRRVVQIMRLDVVKRRGEPIFSLGSDAVFLGGNVSISVDASAFSNFIKPNCIYLPQFEFPGEDRKRMAIYSIAHEYLEWLFVSEPPNRICSALWIVPSF